ncbi:MAG: hypothetical protein ACOCYB_03145 [Alkalispirochaeta sp.]
MSPGVVRIAKVAALPVVAAAVVLLAEFLISIGTYREVDPAWDELVSEELGTVGRPVVPDDPVVSGLWPLERGDTLTGAVAVASAPGYRSRIEVAVSVDVDGAEQAQQIVVHGESAYVRRALESGGRDALSAATLTERGIEAAAERARSAALRYIEEQR